MKTQHTPHTPGPWKWDGKDLWKVGDSLWSEDNPHIYTGINLDEKLRHSPVLKANARLIAAAPTMYDYLTLLASGGDDKAHEIISQISRP